MDNAFSWSKPIEVSDIDLAFPANVDHLMPEHSFCTAELDALPDSGRFWIEFQRKWFFNGLPSTTTFNLRDGIDRSSAIRHLGAIQGSFQPKHEHKEAAVAYLASLWFESVDYGLHNV